MTKISDKKTRRKIRKRRSSIIKGTPEIPRVVLSESNRYLRVQAIDDKIGHTLAYSSTEEKVVQQKIPLEKKEGKEIEKTEENQPGKSGRKSFNFGKQVKERRKTEKEFSRPPLQKEVLATKRVVKVTKGGRRFSFTTLLLV